MVIKRILNCFKSVTGSATCSTCLAGSYSTNSGQSWSTPIQVSDIGSGAKHKTGRPKGRGGGALFPSGNYGTSD